MGKIYRSKSFNEKTSTMGSGMALDPFSWDDRPLTYIEAHFDDLGRCWRLVFFGLSAIRGASPPNDAIAKTFFNKNDEDAPIPMSFDMKHATSIENVEEFLKRVPNIIVDEWEVLND